VIAIIAILASLLLSAVQQARQTAKRIQCANNIHQIAIASHLYLDQNNQFPEFTIFSNLLPYIDQENLAAQGSGYDGYDDVVWINYPFYQEVLPLLLCPSQPANLGLYGGGNYGFGGWAMTSYGGCYGTSPTLGYANGNPSNSDGMFPYDGTVIDISSCTDGTSNTFLFAERDHSDPGGYYEAQMGYSPLFWGWWAYDTSGDQTLSAATPINYTLTSTSGYNDASKRTGAYGSLHFKGANFAFTDGHVMFIKETISQAHLSALSTRAGGESVPGY
jgi:prepilin-type processing-associated H-X9-DG protein